MDEKRTRRDVAAALFEVIRGDRAPEEYNQWLECTAKTCLAHIRFMEENPEDLTIDDHGIRELEEGFLALYGLALKHQWLQEGLS